jgi:hypothetical protein
MVTRAGEHGQPLRAREGPGKTTPRGISAHVGAQPSRIGPTATMPGGCLWSHNGGTTGRRSLTGRSCGRADSPVARTELALRGDVLARQGARRGPKTSAGILTRPPLDRVASGDVSPPPTSRLTCTEAPSARSPRSRWSRVAGIDVSSPIPGRRATRHLSSLVGPRHPCARQRVPPRSAKAFPPDVTRRDARSPRPCRRPLAHLSGGAWPTWVVAAVARADLPWKQRPKRGWGTALGRASMPRRPETPGRRHTGSIAFASRGPRQERRGAEMPCLRTPGARLRSPEDTTSRGRAGIGAGPPDVREVGSPLAPHNPTPPAARTRADGAGLLCRVAH